MGLSKEHIRQYVSLTPKDGFRICKKCLRELPLDIKYFNPDKNCPNGLRFICRECAGKPFKTHGDDWSRDWTEEELDILKKCYAEYTGRELKEKYFPDRTIRAIECAGAKLGIVKNDVAKAKANKRRADLCRASFTGRSISDETKLKLSIAAKERYRKFGSPTKGLKWSEESKRKASERKKAVGKWKGDANPRHTNPLNGKDNPNWKGGTTPLYHELRSDTREWFIESGALSHFKCLITGLHLDNVHHLVPFRDIVDEVFEVLGLVYKRSIADYTPEEEENIRSLLKELHIQYGHGIGLNKEVHKLFHDNYGYFNSTKGDFKSFVIGIKHGVYDDYFKEHNLPINLNIELLDKLLS